MPDRMNTRARPPLVVSTPTFGSPLGCLRAPRCGFRPSRSLAPSFPPPSPVSPNQGYVPEARPDTAVACPVGAWPLRFESVCPRRKSSSIDGRTCARARSRRGTARTNQRTERGHHVSPIDAFLSCRSQRRASRDAWTMSHRRSFSSPAYFFHFVLTSSPAMLRTWIPIATQS